MKGGVESIEFKEGELLVETQQQVVARCSKSQFNKSNAPTQTLNEGEQSTQQEQLDKIFDQFTQQPHNMTCWSKWCGQPLGGVCKFTTKTYSGSVGPTIGVQ